MFGVLPTGQERVKAQRAAVLPLILLLCIPLFALVGLAIDTGIVLSARNNQLLTTQNAGLASLSEYLGQILNAPTNSCPQSCINNAALDAAVARAQSVAKMNVNLVTSRLTTPNNPIDSFVKSTSGTGGIGTTQEGFLEIGEYFFEDLDPQWDGQTCPLTGAPSYCSCGSAGTLAVCKPCTSVGRAGKSCFIGKSSGSSHNTAIRFTTQVLNSNRLRTLFLKVVGIKDISFKVTTIATLIPRNDVFLIDLSRSIVRDNYWSKGNLNSPPGPGGGVPEKGSRSEFVYAADPAFNPVLSGQKVTNGALCGPSAGCIVDPAFSVPRYTTDLMITPNENEIFSTGDQESFYVAGDPYYGMYETSTDYPGGVVPFYMHFRDEYRYYSLNLISSAGVTYPSDFLIHDGLHNGGADPEPLFSVLSSVHSGMTILSDRKLGSDSLSIYGFDSEGQNPPGNGLNVSASPRFMESIRPTLNDPIFQSFYDATDIGSGNLQYIDRGLFPVPIAFSDVFAALAKGLNTITSQGSFKYSKNSIFLFTDGLANCPHKTVIAADGTASFPLTPPSASANLCSHRGDYILASIGAMINNNFVNLFKKRKVAVNIALVGDGIEPHFLARASSKHYGCISQSEASQNKLSEVYVNSGFDSYSGTSYDGWSTYATMTTAEKQVLTRSGIFRAPNELYRLSRDTEGLWIPIMPQAFSGGVPLVFEDALYSACETKKATAGTLVTSTQFTLVDEVTGKNVVDSKGRVIFDPRGRTPAKQMQDAMGAVLSNPFILAE